MRLINILATTLLLFLIACEKEDSGPSNTPKKLDIVDAEAIFVAPSKGSSLGRLGQRDFDKIYKVTPSGLVIEVTFLDEKGNPSQIEKQPTNIINVSDEYLIAIFDYTEGYLVRKSDGSLFALGEDVPQPSEGRPLYYYGDYVSQDNQNNIYFITQSNVLVKIDVSNPAQLTRSTHSATGDALILFVLDPEGNVGYSGLDNGGNQILRYRKSSGGFELFPGATNYSFTTFWTDFSGALYYYNGSLTPTNVKTITPSPFAASDYGTTYLEVGCGFTSVLKIPDKNKIVALGGCTFMYELFNENGEPTQLPYSTINMASIKLGGSSDNYYYVSGTSMDGKPVLIKVDPIDHTFGYLINGDYDLYKMTVSDSDKIFFNALRMEDGSIVIGQINESGEVEILQESLPEEVTFLEKVK